MACGADDEHVAEALVEDDLRGQTGVRTAEQDHVRVLPVGESSTVLDTLARMLRFSGHKTVVSIAQNAPGFTWCLSDHAQ